EPGADLGGVGEVHIGAGDPGAEFPGVLFHLAGSRAVVEIAEGDVPAVRGQPPHGGRADSARTSAHQGHAGAAVQPDSSLTPAFLSPPPDLDSTLISGIVTASPPPKLTGGEQRVARVGPGVFPATAGADGLA